MREYRFSVYRPSVHAGAVAFNMTNFGEDAHNLRVSGPGGYRSAVSRDVEPGAHLRFTVHLLRAGTYRLVCLKPGTRAGHEGDAARHPPPLTPTVGIPTPAIGVRVS
jgi:hypothetical protein